MASSSSAPLLLVLVAWPTVQILAFQSSTIMLLLLLVANGISKSKSKWASNCGDINESNRIIKGNCTSPWP